MVGSYHNKVLKLISALESKVERLSLSLFAKEKEHVGMMSLGEHGLFCLVVIDSFSLTHCKLIDFTLIAFTVGLDSDACCVWVAPHRQGL